MVVSSLAAAAVLSCRVQADRWVAPNHAVRTLFDCAGWSCRVTQPVQLTPLWLASWLPAVDKSRGSESVDVQKVWEVHDERLQFMSRHDAIQLDEYLDADEVSRAWLVWSGAAETALADAYQFCGGPIPSKGLVLGRGSDLFRVVRLGGHQVRKARGNASDVHDAADVFLCRDSSLAPWHDMRRRFKAVMVVLGAMIQYGVSLSRSVELTAQWDRILAAGPLYLVTIDDLSAVRGLGIGDFHRVVADVHHRLSDFIHAVVVHRRDEAIRGGGIGFGRTPWCIPIGGSGLIWCSLLHISSVSPILRLVVLECLLIQPGLMRNSERPGLPTFVALGKRIPALEVDWRGVQLLGSVARGGGAGCDFAAVFVLRPRGRECPYFWSPRW